MKIKIKCPAKINLDLKVFKKDAAIGFHPIESRMQTINLFDFLTLELNKGYSINLAGKNKEIPYNKDNLCYKAASAFLNKIKKDYSINIFIEKNIPVCAGLAGGSTDAAGVLYGLNMLLDYPLNNEEINELALSIGSDINFCLKGGRQFCSGRGEKMKEEKFQKFDLTLIKPKNLKISAHDAYSAFDNLEKTPNIKNYLEFALLNNYEEIRFLNSLGLQMSGSGPTFFLIGEEFNKKIDENKYLIIKNLSSINHGVIIDN